ncbi:MAG: ABC transporter substrate-binding protein [Promethearchaeota archaeon]
MKAIGKIVILAIVIGAIVGSLAIMSTIQVSTKGFDEEGYFVDSVGRKVKVPEHPERIISLAPSITETLYAIQVQDRVVGVTDYCNYPKAVVSKTRVGGFSSPNLNVIISLEPDLVIGEYYDAQMVETLENNGITMVILIAHSMDEIVNNIRFMGQLVDAESQANELADTMQYRIDKVVFTVMQLTEEEKKKCYFEVWETPIVAGGESFINDMIEKAGGINIFGNINEEFPTVSHEAVINGNPDVIFITVMGRKSYTVNVKDREGYDVINAVINDQIYVCDDDVFTRAGPRSVQALELMAEYLYPELF